LDSTIFILPLLLLLLLLLALLMLLPAQALDIPTADVE